MKMRSHLDYFDPVEMAADIKRGYPEFNTTSVYREFIERGGVAKLTEEQARVQAKKWYNDPHAVDDGLACLKQCRAEYASEVKDKQALADLFPYEVLFKVAY